jgi:methyl-accepting chemotaxis protein
MMDINCTGCGKKYRIDETKIKGLQAKVKCKACNNIIVVIKPRKDAPPAPSGTPGIQHSSESAQIPARADQPVLGSPAIAAAPSPSPAEKEVTTFDNGISPFSAEHPIRFGLFTKIILALMIVSLLPFAVFWGITLRETNARIRADTETLMAQTATGLASEVDKWIASNVSILRTAARLPEIISMNREQQEPILRAVQQEHPWIYLVFTLGRDGINVARNDDLPPKDYSDRQYYKDILRGKKISWQTLIGKTSQAPALVLAVPIIANDRLVGMIAAAMTIEDLSKNIANWRKDQTGYAFLVDEKGHVISHPNSEYVTQRKNLNSHPLIAGFREKGWTTITAKFRNPDGQPAFLGHARSSNFGWILVLAQQDSEVFAALNRLKRFALTLLACTVLLVAVIAWFSARAIVNPIMQLTDAAERISMGALNIKIDVSSKDEIGLLAKAITRMQTSLQLAMDRLRRKR